MWLSSWLCVPARTTWPCSHQSSGAEWSLSVCQVVVWGQSQPCLCVSVGGSSHPTATAGQCEQREALLSVQAALLLGCLNTGLLLRSSLKIWGLPLTLSYRSWDLLSSGSHTTCLLLEREKVVVTHWGMSLLVAEQ